MSWVRLDDGFPDHPKVIGLSDAAIALWTRARCWINRQRTAGIVPAAALWRLSRARRPRQAAAELVAAGLWEPKGDDAWRFHDYQDYEPAPKEGGQHREHPGERPRQAQDQDELRAAVREACRLGAQQGDLARRAGLHPTNLSNFLHGRRGLGPELAERLRAVVDATPPERVAMVGNCQQSAMAARHLASGNLPATAELSGTRLPEGPIPIPDLSDTPSCVPEDVDAMRRRAREGTHTRGDEVGNSPEPEDPCEAIDAAWLRARMGHPVFAPLLREGEGHLDELAGNIAFAGVRPEEAEAALREFALKKSGYTSAEDLLQALGGYLVSARNRRRAGAAPLNDHERRTLEMWHELWSKEHGGERYEEAPRDREVIRHLTDRARRRAAELDDGTRVGDVARHFLTGYLALDDRDLATRRYPLGLLLSRLPTIGQYTPRPARRAADEQGQPVEAQVPPPPMEELAAKAAAAMRAVGAWKGKDPPLLKRAGQGAA